MYCEATDSESGHYTCGSSGEKVCLEGWTNPTQHCLTRELCVCVHACVCMCVHACVRVCMRLYV